MPETPSVYFPDEYVTFPAQRGRRNRTTIVEAQGREQRRAEWSVGGRRSMRGRATPLARANWQVVRDFERARQGSYGSFYIFAANVETFVDWSIGTGYPDYPITLPFKARTGIAHGTVLKGDGADLSATFDSGGAGGELRATAGDDPSTLTLTVSTTARERIVVRFADDSFEYEILEGGDEYIVSAVNVIELL